MTTLLIVLFAYPLAAFPFAVAVGRSLRARQP